MTELPEMPCQEVVEVVTDYLDGALSPDDRARFEEHLALCGPCRIYLEQIRETRRLTGQLRDEDVPGPLRDAVLQAFRART